MPGQQYYVQCRLVVDGEPQVVESSVKLTSPAAAAELDQQVELPDALPPLRLTQYIPQAKREQTVVVAEGSDSRPAVELSIVGPTQSFRRWLMAGDMERNRLTSYIGTWRYMAVADRSQRDELFEQFRNEFRREPKLRVSRVDKSVVREVKAQPGEVQHFEDLGCTVRVATFYPHFAVDKKTNEPVNQSERRLNPAARVEIEAGDQSETRWVFAKFPDFSMQRSETVPYRITLDCPVELEDALPDHVLVIVAQREHEVWIRDQGEIESRRLLLDQRVRVGTSQYAFHLARFIPSGRLLEEYAPSTGRGGLPVLQLETSDVSGKLVSLWLGLNDQRVIPTRAGPMTVRFASRRDVPQGVHP